MGQYMTAWVGFGFPVPEKLTNEEMEQRLRRKEWPEVGYLDAAGYNNSRMYVVTYAKSASPGELTEFNPPNACTEDEWRDQLVEVAKANGWLAPESNWCDLDVGWFVTADHS